MKQAIAIKVDKLTKEFKLPHEKYTTAKQRFVNIFSRTRVEKLKALDKVSFEVKKGEFFGIIGENGSGKSTLLKILAKIYLPSTGSVEVNGKLSPFIELGVGFNPELTARENVFLNGAILGLSKKETEGKFDEIIKFAELEQFVDQKLKNFSSGMQVRLAFSIAIQAKPEILLIDEVLAVGDAAFQQKCFDVFRNLKKKGTTVVFVSHALATVEEFCDRVMLLVRGEMSKIGDTKRVIQKYQSSTLTKRSKGFKKSNETNRWGSGEVRFKLTKIIDKRGNTTTFLKSGQEYSFIFNYDLREHVDKVNIGVGIYSVQGSYCFSINTKMDGYKLDIGKKAVLRIPNFPLNKGEYYYNIVCFGNEETQPYDWLGEVGRFFVENDIVQRGVTATIHQWEQF